jgi:hypothetical protein
MNRDIRGWAPESGTRPPSTGGPAATDQEVATTTTTTTTVTTMMIMPARAIGVHAPDSRRRWKRHSRSAPHRELLNKRAPFTAFQEGGFCLRPRERERGGEESVSVSVSVGASKIVGWPPTRSRYTKKPRDSVAIRACMLRKTAGEREQGRGWRRRRRGGAVHETVLGAIFRASTLIFGHYVAPDGAHTALELPTAVMRLSPCLFPFLFLPSLSLSLSLSPPKAPLRLPIFSSYFQV